jgi:hypothetical protein
LLSLVDLGFIHVIVFTHNLHIRGVIMRSELKARLLLFLSALLVSGVVSAGPGVVPTAWDYRRIEYKQVEEYGGAVVDSGTISYFSTGSTTGIFDESVSNTVGSVSQNSFAPKNTVNYGPVFLHGAGSAHGAAVDIDNPVINTLKNQYEVSLTPTETFTGTLSGTLISYLHVFDPEVFNPHVTVKLYEDSPLGSLIWSYEAPVNIFNGEFSYTGAFVANQQYALVITASAWSNQYAEASGGSWEFTFTQHIPVVEIDVLPGDEANKVYPNKGGNLPVAVLSSAEFDATQVDPVTLRFAVEEAAVVGEVSISDVDGLFGDDTTARFKVGEAGILCNDTEVALTGSTYAGEPFAGTDSIDASECETGCHAY